MPHVQLLMSCLLFQQVHTSSLLSLTLLAPLLGPESGHSFTRSPVFSDSQAFGGLLLPV